MRRYLDPEYGATTRIYNKFIDATIRERRMQRRRVIRCVNGRISIGWASMATRSKWARKRSLLIRLKRRIHHL